MHPSPAPSCRHQQVCSSLSETPGMLVQTPTRLFESQSRRPGSHCEFQGSSFCSPILGGQAENSWESHSLDALDSNGEPMTNLSDKSGSSKDRMEHVMCPEKSNIGLSGATVNDRRHSPKMVKDRKSKDRRSLRDGDRRHSRDEDRRPSKDADRRWSKDADRRLLRDADRRWSKDADRRQSKDADRRWSKDADRRRSKDADRRHSKDAEWRRSKDADRRRSRDSDRRRSRDADRRRSRDAERRRSRDKDRRWSKDGNGRLPKDFTKVATDAKNETVASRILKGIPEQVHHRHLKSVVNRAKAMFSPVPWHKVKKFGTPKAGSRPNSKSPLTPFVSTKLHLASPSTDLNWSLDL